jgi:hypothetical protein
MDSLFVAACQGLGLALAAGVLAGAPGRSDGLGNALGLLAAVAGGFLFGISLGDNGHAEWPGYLVGAACAIGAYLVARDVASGAASRASAGSPLAVSAFIAMFALILAGLSLLFGPLSLVGLAGLVVLGVGRRRRAARKHEGLRVLR